MKNKLDFGIIGHQVEWPVISGMINQWRDGDMEPVGEADVKRLFPVFPPRSLFDIVVNSTQGLKAHGKYIESFLSPEHILKQGHIKENIEKIQKSARVAIKHGIEITTLGGFTSIVLEGNLGLLEESEDSIFTTGNSLTSALVCKGIEEAAPLLSIDLTQSKLLVLGATGDIGTACARYFGDKVEEMILVARNERRLLKHEQALGFDNSWATTDLAAVLPEADVIIAVASSADIPMTNHKPGVLILDAGYPHNLRVSDIRSDAHLFYGGMGHVSGDYTFTPNYQTAMYCFPHPKVAHGCILESVVLSFENIFEPYSSGRGNITVESMARIMAMSEKHGIGLAPFYNDKGMWKLQLPQHATL